MRTYNIHKKTLSYYILLALEQTIDGYVRLEDFTYHNYIYARGYNRPLKKSQLAQAIKRLGERGLVETEIGEDEVLLKLTELGVDVLGGNFEAEDNWDGKWRIVLFDIPEQKRRIRDLLRRKLKHWGFKNWQQSVWVTKSNVTEKLRETVKNLGIEEWVAVIESDDIPPDHKIFNGRG